jgi:hypothetical protein
LGFNLMERDTLDRFVANGCWATGGMAHGQSGSCNGDYDAINLERGISIAGYSVGGALLVGGAVMMVLTRFVPHAREHARIDCGAMPGAIGVSCVGRF